MNLNSAYNNTNAKAGELSVTASDTDFTIEVADEPVFAVMPVEVNVEEATAAGYTLTAYAENTNLVSTTDSSRIIPMVSVDGEELVALGDNTYGLSLTSPASREEKVYTALSSDSSNPTILKTVDGASSDSGDTTTIYYGFYITPDVPYGTYTSSNIYYKAKANVATVIYDGNGLYFNGDASQTENMVDYLNGITDETHRIAHTPNLNSKGEKIPGEYIHFGTYINEPVTIQGATKIKVKLKYGLYEYIYHDDEYWAYMTMWEGNHPEYTAADNYAEGIKQCGSMSTTDGRINGYPDEPVTVECELTGDSVTFGLWTQPGGGPGIGYGYYAEVTGYDADGNVIYLSGNNEVSGEYKEPAQELPYVFLGWNEDKDAASATYESKNDIALDLSLTLNETTTLYAIWQRATRISFDGNGSTSGELPDVELIGGTSTSLCNPYIKKTGYAYDGWNTKADGSGDSYHECYWYTASREQSLDMTLYAQWVPATTVIYEGNGGEGDPVSDLERAGDTVYIWDNWGYFVNDGYHFVGWNTEPDGSGTTYRYGDTFVASDQSETLTLYAQWVDCMPNVICYNPNGADGETLTSDQYVNSDTDVTLFPSNLSYTGHGFAGWSQDADAATKITDSDVSNDPTVYGPNQIINTGDLSAKGMTLYAVWMSPAEDKDGNTLTFQTENLFNIQLTEVEGDTLANKPIGYVTALLDTRDDNVYAVAKLADGNYWMIENLRLGNTAEITTTNTNNPFTINGNVALKNNDGNFTNHLSPSNNIEWCSDYRSADCLNQSYMNNENVINAVSMGNGYGNTYSYGNYYNWYSATAGQGTYEKGSGDTAGDICPAGWMLPRSGKGTEENGSFVRLDVALGNTGEIQGKEAADKWRSFPYNYVKSGWWFQTFITNRGNYNGLYWSSTADGEIEGGTHAYAFDIYGHGNGDENVNPASQLEKSNGLSVRCVAPLGVSVVFDGNDADSGEMLKQYFAPNETASLYLNEYSRNDYFFAGWNTKSDGSGDNYSDGANFTASNETRTVTLYAQWEVIGMMVNDLNYMQDFATLSQIDKASVITSMVEGNQYMLEDSRDGKVYFISKLADGNVWMTQNLDHDIGDIEGGTYTAADTDLAFSSISDRWTPSSDEYTRSSDNTAWEWLSDAPVSYDPGDLFWNGEIRENWDGNIDNGTVGSSSDTPGGFHYHLGNYYNWTAALAMSDSGSYDTQYQEVDQSICPAGWRLPSYSGKKSFQNLVSLQGLTSGVNGNIQNSPSYFTYGGMWLGSDMEIGSSGRFYLSNTVYNEGMVYALRFNVPEIVYPQDDDSRSTGSFVRCIVR